MILIHNKLGGNLSLLLLDGPSNPPSMDVISAGSVILQKWYSLSHPFFCGCKATRNGLKFGSCQVPCNTRVQECAGLPEALLPFAGNVDADFLIKVPWEYVQGACIRIPEIEKTHFLTFVVAGFGHRSPHFFDGQFGEFSWHTSYRGGWISFPIVSRSC